MSKKVSEQVSKYMAKLGKTRSPKRDTSDAVNIAKAQVELRKLWKKDEFRKRMSKALKAAWERRRANQIKNNA